MSRSSSAPRPCHGREKERHAAQILAVLGRRHAVVAGRLAAADVVFQARADMAVLRVAFENIQVAGAVFEDALEDAQCGAQPAAADKRSVELAARATAVARDAHAREGFVPGDFDEREVNVALRVEVERRLEVLDEAVFQHEGFDFRSALDELDLRDAGCTGSRSDVLVDLVEVLADALADVLVLADVEFDRLLVAIVWARARWAARRSD